MLHDWCIEHLIIQFLPHRKQYIVVGVGARLWTGRPRNNVSILNNIEILLLSKRDQVGCGDQPVCPSLDIIGTFRRVKRLVLVAVQSFLSNKSTDHPRTGHDHTEGG